MDEYLKTEDGAGDAPYDAVAVDCGAGGIGCADGFGELREGGEVECIRARAGRDDEETLGGGIEGLGLGG